MVPPVGLRSYGAALQEDAIHRRRRLHPYRRLPVGVIRPRPVNEYAGLGKRKSNSHR